jgi:hypothetical protein
MKLVRMMGWMLVLLLMEVGRICEMLGRWLMRWIDLLLLLLWIRAARLLVLHWVPHGLRHKCMPLQLVVMMACLDTIVDRMQGVPLQLAVLLLLVVKLMQLLLRILMLDLETVLLRRTNSRLFGLGVIRHSAGRGGRDG